MVVLEGEDTHTGMVFRVRVVLMMVVKVVWPIGLAILNFLHSANME